MKDKVFYWLKRLGAPVVTTGLGIILVLRPDTASALIAQILGWVLAAVGGGCVAAALLGHPLNKVSRLLWGGVLTMAGLWMLSNPLVLAKFIGRVLGIALLIQGGRDISLRYTGGRPELTTGFILAAITALVGLILLMLPLTTSRVLFMLIGLVLTFLGIGEIYDRLKGRPGIDHGDDPNIIDVEKL